MRRCINVNHIRHKLIHLNSIETICVLKIALLYSVERRAASGHALNYEDQVRIVVFLLSCSILWKL